MGIVLVLMETVMDLLVSIGNRSPSIAGLLKHEILMEHVAKHTTGNIFLMIKSWWFITFVIVFVLESIRIIRLTMTTPSPRCLKMARFNLVKHFTSLWKYDYIL